MLFTTFVVITALCLLIPFTRMAAGWAEGGARTPPLRAGVWPTRHGHAGPDSPTRVPRPAVRGRREVTSDSHTGRHKGKARSPHYWRHPKKNRYLHW